MTYSPQQVFKPGAFPDLTYVSRKSGSIGMTYEDRLKLALNTTGYLTCIYGTSKMGKTVLCKRVVPEKSLVSMSGADFQEGDNIWAVIAQHADMPIEGFMTSTFGAANGGRTLTSSRYGSSKEEVIAYFVKNHKTLLIDDFHYAPENVRKLIARQLKDAIGKEFSAIIVSLPHRSDEAIRLNPDLSGRTSMIQLKSWQKEDLESIASSGFNQLGITCSKHLISYLAEESLSSPQLIQSICLNIGLLLESRGSVEGAELTEEICQQAFRMTTSNFEYQEVVRLLNYGPNSRGTKRKKYMLKTGAAKDLYELILLSLAIDPPVTSIRINDLRLRILDLLSSTEINKPAVGTIKNNLNHLLSLTKDKKEELFNVCDIRDDTLYILDPQFLFYLRWGDRADE